MLPDMDELRMGRILRAIRHRLGWRQEDVAAKAGVSQDAVSRLERGHIEGLTIRTVQRIARALDADVALVVRWRGGELDRLLDEGHATLVGAIATLLEADGWLTVAEVTYSVYGERGSIDLIAWHPPTRTLLVVEVKTELTSVEATLRKHDEKVRLAERIAAERFGWQADRIARLLVLPDGSTARRRVARHDVVLGRAYPLRGRELRRWLRDPSDASDASGGIAFQSLTHRARGRRDPVTRKRVRTTREAGVRAGPAGRPAA